MTRLVGTCVACSVSASLSLTQNVRNKQQPLRNLFDGRKQTLGDSDMRMMRPMCITKQKHAVQKRMNLPAEYGRRLSEVHTLEPPRPCLDAYRWRRRQRGVLSRPVHLKRESNTLLRFRGESSCVCFMRFIDVSGFISLPPWKSAGVMGLWVNCKSFMLGFK